MECYHRVGVPKNFLKNNYFKIPFGALSKIRDQKYLVKDSGLFL